MATGPEHYREAERLLEQAAVDSRDPMRRYVEDANVIAAAQVHATLALAAATAEDVVRTPAGPGDHDVQRAWSKAIS